jgi:Phage integrase family
VRLHGKGRKERAIPIAKDLMARLHVWVKTNKVSPDHPIFANRQGAALTREGIALRLDLAVRKAVQTCPSLQGRRITPHTWRHSNAMHLLQAGLPLEVIALWLGHEQPAVTHTYVQADINMKRECMKLLEQPSKIQRKRAPMRFSGCYHFWRPNNYPKFQSGGRPVFALIRALGCHQLGIIRDGINTRHRLRYFLLEAVTTFSRRVFARIESTGRGNETVKLKSKSLRSMRQPDFEIAQILSFKI